ncbi:MAG: twin-arginine translocation pathway signal, partial [Bosea sp. (in: a-proteobacteria)]
MTDVTFSRRSLIIGAGACSSVLINSGWRAHAQGTAGLAATPSMPGGANNYMPKAPMVSNLGKGFLVSGTVRRAGAGEPLANIRIQIWAATERGGEREPSNHGSVLTNAKGEFRLEMSQILPSFGQPHAHLAYDDQAFKTVFLRPVMP